ncbi:MAG: monovalent cation/H+ antiporter subunit D family protein [Acidobacteria bacterium]|nr:MAG: monovalent cation/H+ antiporter subunit D family protein [Acidobacteriota bacterium]
MSEHLPILQVVVPLLAGPLCLLLRHRLLVRGLATAVPLACLTIAGLLLHRVQQVGAISYHIGGWAPPLGIEYRIDLANAYVMVIVSAIAAVVMPFLPGHMGSAMVRRREHLFYAIFLLALAGLLGISATGDMFNAFVFLEIASLASYSLVALGRHRRALVAAYSYLIIGTIGGTFFLLGIGLMYQMTGTLNMVDLAHRLPEPMSPGTPGSRTVLVAFAFLAVGLSIKLAVFPLHQWLPRAYAHAPSAVSAFLAATSTKVSYYLLVRVVFSLFGAAYVFDALKLDRLLLPLSIVAMFAGSTAAIFQTDLKRLLAYSSVAQIGYMTLGVSLASVTGLTGGLVHLFNHALMKGGLFLAAACYGMRLRSSRIADLAGAGRLMPWTTAAFVTGGLALIGVPGTAGFVSKWYLVLAALEQGRWLVAVLVVASSLLAVAYVWRVVEVAYFADRDAGAHPIKEVPPLLLVPTWILIGATVYFGLRTELTAGVAEAAAGVLWESLR